MWGGDCGAVGEGLGGVGVGFGGGIVAAIDLLKPRDIDEHAWVYVLLVVVRGRRTLFMAFMTLGEVMRPFRAMLSIRASFVAPEHFQAIARVVGVEIEGPIFDGGGEVGDGERGSVKGENRY